MPAVGAGAKDWLGETRGGLRGWFSEAQSVESMESWDGQHRYNSTRMKPPSAEPLNVESITAMPITAKNRSETNDSAVTYNGIRSTESVRDHQHRAGVSGMCGEGRPRKMG